MPNNIQTIIDKIFNRLMTYIDKDCKLIIPILSGDDADKIKDILKDFLTSMLDEVSNKAGYYMNDGQLDLMDIKRLIQDIKDGK